MSSSYFCSRPERGPPAGGQEAPAMTILEKEMYRPVRNAKLFAGCTVVCEVRIADWSLSTKRIDMVAIKSRRMNAIELKVRDWRGALRQAYSNLYTADYSYAALWHEAAARVDCAIFRAHGIGVLRVKRRGCEVMIAPKKSPHVIPELRAYALEYCRKEGAR